MRPFFVAFAALTIFVSAPALAINKCTGADGRIVFQDVACSGKGQELTIQPAAGHSPSPAALKASAPASASEAKRLETLVNASQRERRARDLRQTYLPQAEEARGNHRTACAQKQKDLAAQQYAYQQNLYGKTHAAQIASEMAASAALCQTKDRELNDVIEALAKECVALNCRP